MMGSAGSDGAVNDRNGPRHEASLAVVALPLIG
jgi:hypothetical protein